MNKLDKSSKALMTCDLINSIISLFGETFLVAYFLQVSNENIVQISIYYIIIYTLLGIGSLVLGNLMKSKPSKRINIYRVGIIVKSIFILLIVLFKENINQYFMIFAITHSPVMRGMVLFRTKIPKIPAANLTACIQRQGAAV